MAYLACSAAGDGETQLPALNPLRLALANINPITGLATDYLNHFNEAIMLLEILPMDPGCVEDFRAWRPKSYAEHFSSSHFKDREIAIAAYAGADPLARERLEMLADMMTAALTVTREALESSPSQHPPAELAARATTWLKPLVARAGAVINGIEIERVVGTDEDPQAMIDAIMGR